MRTGEASRGRLACPFSPLLMVVWGAEWHRDPRGKSDNRCGAHRGVVVCLLGTCHPRHWADNLKTLWSQIL